MMIHTVKEKAPVSGSIDLIGFSFKIEAYEKFYHRYIVNISRKKFFV